MIEFKKKVKDLLPYNRKEYISLKKWYGVSFQLPGVFEGNNIGVNMYVEAYENWFKNIISKYDNGSTWIVNHDFIDEYWFPNDQDNLASLRTLFKENNIPNTFTGALIFTKEALLKFAKDLIIYPYAVFDEENLLYSNIDISNSKSQFVIKISAHLNIDILTTNKEILKEIVKDSFADNFILKEYRGTSL